MRSVGVATSPRGPQRANNEGTGAPVGCVTRRLPTPVPGHGTATETGPQSEGYELAPDGGGVRARGASLRSKCACHSPGGHHRSSPCTEEVAETSRRGTTLLLRREVQNAPGRDPISGGGGRTLPLVRRVDRGRPKGGDEVDRNYGFYVVVKWPSLTVVG